MELNLVKITDTTADQSWNKPNRVRYFAVNDRHYDAMLAGEIQGLEWQYLGSVFIEEHILTEEGYREHGS